MLKNVLTDDILLTSPPAGFEGGDGIGLVHALHRRPVLEVDLRAPVPRFVFIPVLIGRVELHTIAPLLRERRKQNKGQFFYVQ